MRPPVQSIAHLLLAFLLSSGYGIAADQVKCPPQVEVRQQIAAPVSGWSTLNDDLPQRLAGIIFFEGKPEDKASLAPDNESKANGKSIATWNFGGSDRPIWVACRYAWTTVTLTRELSKQVHACSITYDPRQSLAGLPVIEKIDCK